MPSTHRKNYTVPVLLLFGAVLTSAQAAPGQTSAPQATLSAHWEELTGADFVDAAIKADDVSLKLQNEFNEKSTHPLDTKQ